ncbi:lysosomal acid glucosylceramidase-like [Euwallacea fornicatus]|uniref:lysosomal acid glucosylceramidase-like n=1 Tax=Euwallacea fornicatus TaxID=995702 RepID=UPI00338EF000
MMIRISYLHCIIIILVCATAQEFFPCAQRTTEYGAVCVCNLTYCDTIPPIQILKSGQYQFYTTSEVELGFSSLTGTFSDLDDNLITTASVTITNITDTKQAIIGFGGTFTDSTGIAIGRLSEGAQENFIQSYFGENGVQYSIGRVPVGGTDYSIRGYTYCDEEDETLDSFALQPEDISYKIPIIQRALELRGKENVKLIASGWSAPLWMKVNPTYGGTTSVQEKYYSLFAQYYIKFFEAYNQNNITFWGVTTQNEPINGLLNIKIPNNGFTSSQMKTWIKEAFGPTIRNSSFKDLKILAHDDQVPVMLVLINQVLSDPEVVDYVDGIAVHWYWNRFLPLSWTYNFLPSSFEGSSSTKELFLLSTEACNGFGNIVGIESSVEFGSWTRGQMYVTDIIKELTYNHVAWVDWNMALNMTGGPNWVDNEVDSAILVNDTTDEFYKQPMFYGLGHFSKFVVPGSKRVVSTVTGLGLESISFVRPDGKVAVVMANTRSSTLDVEVQIEGKKGVVYLAANSFNTLLFTV